MKRRPQPIVCTLISGYGVKGGHLGTSQAPAQAPAQAPNQEAILPIEAPAKRPPLFFLGYNSQSSFSLKFNYLFLLF